MFIYDIQSQASCAKWVIDWLIDWQPEDGISVLDGDGDVVFATAGDGGSLTLPEEQSVVDVGRHGHLDDLLVSSFTWMRKQPLCQLYVAAFARKLRLPVYWHAYTITTITITIIIIIVKKLIKVAQFQNTTRTPNKKAKRWNSQYRENIQQNTE